ncbi:MAG TPA: DUF1499 domain-containing protein [Dissulfurispiraceae bacterium]|nr:DUF1499 domain-containing protein [Dissulfurispiraceae bacterium]
MASNDDAMKGRLAPCPSSPNCVSSLSADEGHFIEPLRYASSPDDAMKRLRKIIMTMERATITTDVEGYIHVEFRTLLGFVDDAQFLLDSKSGVIHVRSASRTGYWDLGVNRSRIESIRERFIEAEK